MQKVVNIMVPKNNAFCQLYPFTTFGVIFYHPSGLTEAEDFEPQEGSTESIGLPSQWEEAISSVGKGVTDSTHNEYIRSVFKRVCITVLSIN